MAVTNEALRIHPSTGLILERCTPKGGVTLHGKYIPENTIIGVNCWVVNRDKGIFGDDAHSFRPERWIDRNPKDVARMRTNMFTVCIHLSVFASKKEPGSNTTDNHVVRSWCKELHRKELSHDATHQDHCRALQKFSNHTSQPG